MNIFDLSAKLTLDTSEYERGASSASKGADTLKSSFSTAGTSSETLKNQIAVLAGQYEEAQKKVAQLEEEFNRSVAATGATSDESRELAAKLAEAEKEALDLSKGLDAMSEAAEGTGNKFSGLGEKIGKGLKVAAAAGAAAITAAATAIGALTKQSVESYSEYEQLVGGSQLLFGDAYDFVAEKAANAFSTVQMSQADYLQQVNGFAVGLRESLGGNEQAAAELADRILTAEADIVAATGVSQEAVQNAFNGIMKSNYSMLDNLQLGITPTKEGLQEVIDKVNEWNEANGKASNYVIDNLADVENALVDYVEMQGLAGYAANEAASTIQGSLSQMKAAWENLLTGLADPSADLDKLIDNMISSAETALENLAPVIERALTGIGAAVEKLAPVVAERLPALIEGVLPALINAAGALVNGLVAALPTIIQVLVDVLPDIIIQLSTAIIDNLPALLEAVWELITGVLEALWQVAVQLAEIGWEWILNLTQGIRDKISDTVQAGQELWQNFKDNLHAKISEALQQGVEWIVNLIQGIRDKISDTVAAAAELWQNVKSDLASRVGDMLSQGQEWIANLISGITGKISDVVAGVEQLWQNVKSTISGKVSELWQMGVDWIQGLVDGVVAKAGALIDAVTGAVQGAINWAKNLLGIASPSKVFKKIGEYVDEGFAEGIEAKEKEPIQQIKDLANQIIAIVDNMNKKVNDTLTKTVEDVAYIANMDYSAAMLKAENIEEFQGLAKLRDAKIAGEGIDLSAQGWKSNEDLLREWQESLDKQTAAIQSTYKQGDRVLKQGDAGYDDRPIITQVVLDGKVVGEAAYKYSKLKARMVGA